MAEPLDSYNLAPEAPVYQPDSERERTILAVGKADALRIVATLASWPGMPAPPFALGHGLFRNHRRDRWRREARSGTASVACPRCRAAKWAPCDPRTLGRHLFHRARVEAFERHKTERSARVSAGPTVETQAER